MTGTQRLLAIAMAFSLCGVSTSGRPDTFAVIVQADRARLGSQAASEGTTIFDGDRLSTDLGGSLKVQIAEASLYLTEASSVIVHYDAKGPAREFVVEIVTGIAVLSETPKIPGEIVASTARVRPVAETRGVVQVRMVGPNEIVVFAQLGPAEISYHGVRETIAEGKMYRVLLNPSDDGASGVQGAKRSGKRGKAFVLVAVGAATAAGVALLLRSMDRSASASTSTNMESPDRP